MSQRSLTQKKTCFSMSICDKHLGRKRSAESSREPSNSRILQSFDDIHGTLVLGLNESTENKNGNFDLGHKSVPGDNSKLEGKKGKCEKSELEKKIESSDKSNVLRVIGDINSAKLEQTIVNSEKSKLAVKPKSCKNCDLAQSCRKGNNTPSTHFTRGSRILAHYEMNYEPHVPGGSKHVPPYNNKYHEQHIGAGNSGAAYPNNYGSNFVVHRNDPGHGAPYDNQFNGVMKILSDCKETCESQFEGMEETTLITIATTEISTEKGVEINYLTMTIMQNTIQEEGEEEMNHIIVINTNIRMQEMDRISQYGEGNINQSNYDNYYDEHHYSGGSAPIYNEKYDSQYGEGNTNQSNYNAYYNEHHYSGENAPQYNSYESQYAGGNDNHPNNSGYYEASYAGEGANTTDYNDTAGLDYVQSEQSTSGYTQNYGPKQGELQNYMYGGGHNYGPQQREPQNYTYGGGHNYGPQQGEPQSNASYEVKNIEPETKLLKKEMPSVADSAKKEMPDLSAEKEVPENKKDLQPELVREENKLDDKKSNTSSIVSPNIPTLHHRGNSESRIAAEKKPMPNPRMNIHSGNTAIRKDISGGKSVQEGESAKSDSRGTHDLHSSILKKNTSDTKLNVETKTDKTEHATSGSKEKLHLSNMSIKKSPEESKQHFDSKIYKLENKTTGQRENSPMPNAGLKKKPSDGKLHLDSKTDKTDNAKTGSKEKLQVQNTGIKKNTSDTKLNADAKNDKHDSTKKGSKEKPPEITEVKKNSLDGKINSEEKTYKSESKTAGNEENSSVHSALLKKNTSHYKKHGESKEAELKHSSSDKKMDGSKSEQLESDVTGSKTVESGSDESLNNPHESTTEKKSKKKNTRLENWHIK
ncbi:hypothetical protein PCYB_081090 [Plasmodium cynomolgi strain B]|uniref:Uncharacterized protein n=1 Tax=Plasmodium cynomolgi (strain B) TaxID=1120755 RepID=K6UJH0_PLACD|nr:hypothetical protein PCYB_081090 [Plasmodium cynomolgi strain B]GAB65948.1 hypothetical protein PCYB_081090 [Plasmodium cynomolgi strain B]